MVTSDGIKVPLPTRWIGLEPRQRRLQRELSRKVKGSKNRANAKIKLARCFEATANAREDFLHQRSIQILRSYDILGIEDLNVTGMMKNPRLDRASRVVQVQGISPVPSGLVWQNRAGSRSVLSFLATRFDAGLRVSVSRSHSG